MIRLRDEIEIEASPEQLFDWLTHLPENYLAWHPAHLSCRYLRGARMELGAVLAIEEYLHGKLHQLRLRLTKVVPGCRLEYSVSPGLNGAFEVEPQNGKTRFVATLTMGINTPILGTVLDWMIRLLFGRRIETLAQHMAEEGENLRAIFGSVRKS